MITPEDIEAIIDKTLRDGHAGLHFEDLLVSLCEALVASGVPLLRANFSMRARHPEIGAFAYRWKRKTGMIREEYVRDPNRVTGWDDSPLKYLVDGNADEMHRSLRADARPFEFPMFEDLVDMGATDYFAQRVRLTETLPDESPAVDTSLSGLLVSWTSDAETGFSNTDLTALRRITPPLALALKANANFMTATDLLATYLGPDAGRRVITGDYIRGSIQTIPAVILYFDLSGFTKLSEALPSHEIIDLLNDYFASAVDIVETHGGDVLKFMGDGMLAIFDKTRVEDAERVAVQAIIDLKQGQQAVTTTRKAEDKATTGFTIAAHAGDVAYGNIGGRARLDFTVIGPAVNTAARILGMAPLVDQPIVIGANVAKPAMAGGADLVSLGKYRLRGVAERQELFTMDR